MLLRKGPAKKALFRQENKINKLLPILTIFRNTHILIKDSYYELSKKSF